MKKSYILIVLALVAMVATGCTRDEVVRSISSFRISESGFNDPDTKMHFTLGANGATGGLSRLCYDNGDKVLVNGHNFTLNNTSSTVWVATSDDGNPVEAPRFYTIFKNPGMGISGSGPTYDFNYESNISGQYASTAVTGVILAGSTDDSLLTLNPGCCILRFPANEAMDYVYVGFTANKVPKSGRVTISDAGVPTLQGINYLGGVESENSGQYLQMQSDGDASVYYVAVPITGNGISTQLFFKWKYSATSDIYKYKTSGNVVLEKGKVYTVGKTRVSPFQADGSSKGYFTVGSGRNQAVRFSPGNLQCLPAGSYRWRFAPNQYDYVGQDNSQIQYYDNCTQYLDLFAWAGTGWTVSGTTYYPDAWGLDEDYYNVADNIAGTDGDWGHYLSGNIYYGDRVSTATWRTLTRAEWNYLLSSRPNAAQKWGLATLGGLYSGLILIPDALIEDGSSDLIEWSSPLAFTPGSGNGYNTNTYTMDEWAQMESAGAIFLPACGKRSAYTPSNYIGLSNPEGHYWSTTGVAGGSNAYMMSFSIDGGEWYVDADADDLRSVGRAVRLVRAK